MALVVLVSITSKSDGLAESREQAGRSLVLVKVPGCSIILQLSNFEFQQEILSADNLLKTFEITHFSSEDEPK